MLPVTRTLKSFIRNIMCDILLFHIVHQNAFNHSERREEKKVRRYFFAVLVFCLFFIFVRSMRCFFFFVFPSFASFITLRILFYSTDRFDSPDPSCVCAHRYIAYRQTFVNIYAGNIRV